MAAGKLCKPLQLPVHNQIKNYVPEMDKDAAKIEGSWYVCNWIWNQERKPQ